MTWASGLWGWGEADAGEWQALYRVEGARRALAASREWQALAWRLANRRSIEWAGMLARQEAQRAWRASPEGKAELARLQAEQLAAGERTQRLKARWRTKSPIWAPGSRNWLVWAACRGGRTQRDVGVEFGVSRKLVGIIVRQQERVEEARRALAGGRARDWAARRQDLGRPVDIDAAHGGGPRDVWLEYLPSPDPRLDNMVPVVP